MIGHQAAVASRRPCTATNRLEASHCLRTSVLILTLATSCVTSRTAVAKQEADADPRPAPTHWSIPASRGLTAESATTPSESLPNGASSIGETYGKWAVGCHIVDGKKQCLLLQTQTDGHTGKQTFAIELQVPRDGHTDGTILAPFGLKLDAGAVLTLDDKEFGEGLRFSTCVPQGCLLPVSFPPADVNALKTARMLTVASMNLGNGEVVTFKIPLEGFAAAIARISELGR
jgi:invasion protein IalB